MKLSEIFEVTNRRAVDPHTMASQDGRGLLWCPSTNFNFKL